MKKTTVSYPFLLLCIVMIFTLTACHVPDENRNGNDPLKPNKGENVVDLVKEENDILKEYNELIKIQDNRVNIVKFIDENIINLSKENANQMMMGLIDYLSKGNYDLYESFILLSKYKKYTSLEIKSYLNILFTEASQPYKAGTNFKIGLDMLMERARVAEDHLLIFPNGETRDLVLELYKEYISSLIIGVGDSSVLTREKSSILKDEIVTLYKGAVKEEESKGLSNIFTKYLNLLKVNNYNFESKAIKNFHIEVEKLIEEEFPMIKEMSTDISLIFIAIA